MVDDVISRLREAERRTQPPQPFDPSDAVRRARSRTRRRRVWQAGAGIAASAVIAAGVIAVWPEPPDSTPRPVDTAKPPADPRGRLSLLNEPRNADDELPAELRRRDQLVGNGSLGESTVRFVAEWDGVRYWAGLTDENYVCLLLVASGDGRTWTGGCGGFGDEGMSVGAPVGGSYVDARLLPDGYDPDPDELVEWYFVTPNLVVGKG